MRFIRLSWRSLTVTIIILVLVSTGLWSFVFRGAADHLPNRSLTLSDTRQSMTSTYTVAFDIPSTQAVGSIRLQFCSDTPLVGYPCTAPTGLDASGAVLSAQSGETGFSVGPGGTANDTYLTRTPTITLPGHSQYVLDGVTNPSAVGTYFLRIQTYASADGSGASIDDGGAAFVISSAIDISTRVPPYLLFCSGITIGGYDCATASGDYINFGELSATATKSAQSQLLAATNAQDGYNIWADGSSLLAANAAIPAILTSDVSRPGTSQFGINLAANTTPAIGSAVSGPGTGTAYPNYGTPDRYRFVPGDMLAGAAGVNDSRKYTVSYIVNIGRDQAPGIYISTLTYVCLANF